MSVLEDTFTEDLYSMVLGGLLALQYEQMSNYASIPSGNKTIFLGVWLKRVKKQRLYKRSIAREIDGFIALYTKKGRDANLADSFNEIYHEFKLCKLRLKEFDKSEKNRFYSSIDLLKKQSWVVTLPLIHNYTSDGPYQPKTEKEVFVTEFDWKDVFSIEGFLTKPLSLYVVSAPQSLIDTFYSLGFIVVKVKSKKETLVNYHQLKVFPNNDYSGIAAIPSQIKSGVAVEIN